MAALISVVRRVVLPAAPRLIVGSRGGVSPAVQCWPNRSGIRGQNVRDQISTQRIGVLAEAVGVTVDTLRYYEREGLLPRSSRSAGGFRLYAPEIAERVRFIKQAQMVGLSLREIHQLVAPDDSRCATAREVMAARLTDVDRRLRELTSFRSMLQAALEQCDRTLSRSTMAPCAVVRELGTEKLSRGPEQ